MIILFACLAAWLDSSPIEKNKAWSLKTAWVGLAWIPACPSECTCVCDCACAYKGHNSGHTFYNKKSLDFMSQFCIKF